MRHGPSRGELWFRLALGLAGLALMAVAIVVRGGELRGSIAIVEVVLVAGLVCGGTVLHALWHLFRRDR